MTQVREVPLADLVAGRLWLSPMPGRSSHWSSLEEALRRYREIAADILVCLAEEGETREKSPAYAAALEAGDFPLPRFLHPIEDRRPPADPEAFDAFVEKLAAELRRGRRIVVHCGAGRGRSGLLAACVLARLGLDEHEALERVRSAGGGPENGQQEAFLQAFVARTGAG